MVSTEKVAVVEPPGIFAVAGTVTSVVLAVTLTNTPPTGAGWAIVTVAVTGFPPMIVDGLNAKLDTTTEV